MNTIIQEAADKTLKRKYVKRRNKKGVREPPWMTNEIKEGIKERRKINRERRNETDCERKQMLWEEYLEQKTKVQELIAIAVNEHEKRVSEEIRKNKNKMWENIKKLKGVSTKRESVMYNDQGQKLSEEEKSAEIKHYWQGIYCKHPNEIENEWNDQQRLNYKYQVEERIEVGYRHTLEGSEYVTEVRFPVTARDHVDMAMALERTTGKMDKVKITEEKVRNELKKIKRGKAAGPDGLKGELYIPIADSKKGLTALTNCLRNELEKSDKPQSWKTSRTVLLEKKAKPTAKDYRPVALTDVSYKLYMALLRNEIESHINESDARMEEQAGFTRGSRIEDNLAILKHLIEDARKNKKELIISGIDFAKAFDSIKRNKIVETMKEFKIDERIINTVVEIYREDIVALNIGSETKEEITATSGIRQGCTLSATLFKLITYRIIKELNKKMKGYKTSIVTIRSLFFADDGLLISGSEEEAAKDIKVLQDVAREYGLAINKEKSNIMWINKNSTHTEIEGIQIKPGMKYLGIWFEDTKDIFKNHKENKIRLAERLANNTHSVLMRSCNRLIVGKAYWKNVALPAIIYGSGVIIWNKKEQEKLQVIQNKVCRKMLNAPRWATNSATRGEIGISNMDTRLAQNRQ